MRLLAIPLLVFSLTGSALSLGITYALEFLPFALASLVAGSLADRVDRRRLMASCDIARLLVVVTFAVAAYSHALSLALVYTGTVVLSIAGALFLGSQTPTILYILDKDRSRAAVSMLIGTEQGVNLIAPPIGGALFAIAGPISALAINAFTYCVSCTAILSVRDFGPKRRGAVPAIGTILADIREGSRILVAERAMFALTMLQLGVNFFGSIGYTAIIPLLRTTFGADAAHVGIAFGAIAAGSVLGSFVAARFHIAFGRAMAIAYIIDGLFWLPVGFSPNIFVAVGLIAISSAFAAFEIAYIVSWRMRVLDESVVGRVFGVVRLLVLIGVVPGTVAGGALADHFGPRVPLLASGVCFLAMGLLVATNRRIRSERR